jgi:hypothetical protein
MTTRERIYKYAGEYETFRAAHEGDFGPLIEFLSSGAEITSECRQLIIKVLRGDIQRPPHRQARITTALRARAIAAYVREREAKVKQMAAIAEAAEEFDCSERTVKNALKLEREAKRRLNDMEVLAKDFARLHGKERTFWLVDRVKRLIDEDSLRYGLRRHWWKPLIWEI